MSTWSEILFYEGAFLASLHQFIFRDILKSSYDGWLSIRGILVITVILIFGLPLTMLFIGLSFSSNFVGYNALCTTRPILTDADPRSHDFGSFAKVLHIVFPAVIILSKYRTKLTLRRSEVLPQASHILVTTYITYTYIFLEDRLMSFNYLYKILKCK